MFSVTRRGVTAQEGPAFCQALGITAAVLSATRPSCASVQTYDGTHSKTLRPRSGVAADLLRQHGIAQKNQENDRGQG